MENTVRFVNTLYSTELPHKHIVGLALLTLKSEPLGFCLVSAVFLSIHRVSSQKCVTSVSGSRNLPYYSRIIIWRQLPRSHSLPRRSTSHQRTMFKSGPSNQVSFIQLSFSFSAITPFKFTWNYYLRRLRSSSDSWPFRMHFIKIVLGGEGQHWFPERHAPNYAQE